MSSATRRINPELQYDITGREIVSTGIVFRNLPKKVTTASNPTFRELALDGLADLISKPIPLIHVLQRTHNDTIYGPEYIIRKILLDIYPVVAPDLEKHNVDLDISDSDTNADVLTKFIKVYDKIHPNYDWYIRPGTILDDYKYVLQVERSYEDKVKVQGYAIETYMFWKIQRQEPEVFRMWLMFICLFKKIGVQPWFSTGEHESLLEYMDEQLLNAKSDQWEPEQIAECKRSKFEMESGDAKFMQTLIENSEFCLNDLKNFEHRVRKLRKTNYKKEMLKLVKLAILCLTPEKKMKDFVHIDSDDHPEYYNDAEPITMHDYMQFLWKATNDDHYWGEVKARFQCRWENGGDNIPFTDVFCLSQKNNQHPPYEEWPEHMRDFFNEACSFSELIESKVSKLLIHKVK